MCSEVRLRQMLDDLPLYKGGTASAGPPGPAELQARPTRIRLAPTLRSWRRCPTARCTCTPIPAVRI